jgi:hypothetical protein
VIQPAHHHHPRHPDLGALLPQGDSGSVDAIPGRDHEQRRIRRPQPGPQLAHEVGIARSIHKINLDVGVVQWRDG